VACSAQTLENERERDFRGDPRLVLSTAEGKITAFDLRILLLLIALQIGEKCNNSGARWISI